MVECLFSITSLQGGRVIENERSNRFRSVTYELTVKVTAHADARTEAEHDLPGTFRMNAHTYARRTLVGCWM